MATTKKTGTTTKAKSTEKSVVENNIEDSVDSVTTPVKKEKIIAKDVDPHEYITVRNGAKGRLIYISPKTGERFVWEDFGDEQEIELIELRNAKAANKKFFERNWFMFDSEYDWVIDYLGVRAFYKNSIAIDRFDDLFTKTPAELEKILRDVPAGQKRTIAYRAKQMINDGGIDSMKVIETLEKNLGVALVER